MPRRIKLSELQESRPAFEIIRDYVGNLRVQDLVLVFVSALIVYLLRARDTYVLTPAWQISQSTQKSHGSSVTLPRPIVTDLEDDGNVELVVVTNSLQLFVYDFPALKKNISQVPQHVRLPDLIVRMAVNLSDHVQAIDNLYPIAMDTGYLNKPQGLEQNRSQVIVVMLSDWTVLCFDHDLSLQWKQAALLSRLMSGTLEGGNDSGGGVSGGRVGDLEVKSVGLLIVPHSLNRNQNGTVIVGGSMIHGGHNTRNVKLKSADHSFHHHATDSQDEDDSYSHFSTMAFGGSDGTMQWHHLPKDFIGSNNQKPLEEPIHWKLSLRHHINSQRHISEGHWTKYLSLITRLLPHSWSRSSDTRFEVSDVHGLSSRQSADESHTSSSTAASTAASAAGSEPELAHFNDLVEDFNVEHIIGAQYGGLRPHSRHEHIVHPSVIAVHNHKGIELLDFFTGRPLTQWLIEPSESLRSVYVDMSSTRASIQRVRPNFDLKCQAEVSTIHPHGPRALFEGPLCDSPFIWGGGAGRLDFSNVLDTAQTPSSENTHAAARPAVVKRIGRNTGMLNHLLGRGLSRERRGYDSLFLTSIGRFTSYAPDGQPNWQVVVPAGWSEIAFLAEVDSSFSETELGRAYLTTFLPSIIPLSLQLYAKQTAALVSGWSNIALVDLRDGSLIGQHTLPCQVIDQPITADFSRDGWTDFIITCSDGSFDVASPQAWNRLTLDLRNEDLSYEKFCSDLKTHFFLISYDLEAP